MKKLLSVLLVLLLLTGCGGGGNDNTEPEATGPKFTIENGAYQCTADELLDAVRSYIESVSDSLEFTPAEIPTSGNKYGDGWYRYVVIPKEFIIETTSDDDGHVKEVNLEWTADIEPSNNASLVAFTLFDLLTPTDYEDIVSGYTDAIGTGSSYSADSDGTHVYFFMLHKSEFHLWISPALENK